MVLHSRGCGRVARRRFTRWGFPSSLRSGNPIFYSSCLFCLPAESHAGSRKALFCLFPCSFSRLCPSRGFPPAGVVSFGYRMPENGVVLGAIRAFYGRPIPPETVDSMVRDVADRRSVSSGYHHGIGVVSSGYRRDVWVASFGYGLVSFRYQSVHSGVSDGGVSPVRCR